MITREDITKLASLYDLVPIASGEDGSPMLAESAERDAFSTEKQRLTEVYLAGLVNHPEYQDLTLNQLRLVARTVIANMLAMVEPGAKRKPGKTVRKPKLG